MVKTKASLERFQSCERREVKLNRPNSVYKSNIHHHDRYSQPKRRNFNAYQNFSNKVPRTKTPNKPNKLGVSIRHNLSMKQTRERRKPYRGMEGPGSHRKSYMEAKPKRNTQSFVDSTHECISIEPKRSKNTESKVLGSY